MAGPERFELPTFWFVARHSIQLSYGPAQLTVLASERRIIYGFFAPCVAAAHGAATAARRR